MALYEIMETNQGSIAIVKAESEADLRKAFEEYAKRASTRPSGTGFKKWITGGYSLLVERITYPEIWVSEEGDSIDVGE